MYSAYKLNKQGDNIQPWCTPFLIWNQSPAPFPANCCFLTHIQVSQEAGQVVWYSYLFKNFPQFVVIHKVKGFGIVNKAKICFSGTLSLFQWSSEYWHLISGSSAFLKSCLNIWKFTVLIMLKPCLKNFEHYFAGVWDECNCVVVWTFFGIASFPLAIYFTHGSVYMSMLSQFFPFSPSPAVSSCPTSEMNVNQL